MNMNMNMNIYNFALYPESNEPTGSANFSKYKKNIFECELTNIELLLENGKFNDLI